MRYRSLQAPEKPALSSSQIHTHSLKIAPNARIRRALCRNVLPQYCKMTPALRHVTKISSLSPKEIKGVLKLALEMKARPADYWDALKRRTLLMFFEKPSLRTRVSLEAGTTRCGNQNSPRHRRDVISTQA